MCAMADPVTTGKIAAAFVDLAPAIRAECVARYVRTSLVTAKLKTVAAADRTIITGRGLKSFLTVRADQVHTKSQNERGNKGA